MDIFEFSKFVGPPRAPGWPETDSPRKTIAPDAPETQIRALGAHFVAIFRFSVGAKCVGKTLSLSVFFVPEISRNATSRKGISRNSKNLKTVFCHESGRQWPDLDDTPGFKSWPPGARFGPIPGPRGSKHTQNLLFRKNHYF